MVMLPQCYEVNILIGKQAHLLLSDGGEDGPKKTPKRPSTLKQMQPSP